MKFKLIWKVVTVAAIAAIGLSRAYANEIKSEPKTVKLFVREVPITVAGRTVKVTTIDQSEGVQGYSPEKSDGFHGMAHPMHLHGHVFEVTEIDGQKISGAKRDTILVPPKSTIKIVFEADNPGVWAYHCHILYHLAAGMFTVLKYDGADKAFWQPDKTKAELENPLELGSAGNSPRSSR